MNAVMTAETLTNTRTNSALRKERKQKKKKYVETTTGTRSAQENPAHSCISVNGAGAPIKKLTMTNQLVERRKYPPVGFWMGRVIPLKVKRDIGLKNWEGMLIKNF